MMFRVAVIGLGKLGSALCEILQDSGHEIAWVVTSRDVYPHINTYRSIPERPSGAEVVFISTPDSVIKETAEDIAGLWKGDCKGMVFFHLSGLLTSDQLSPLAQYGAETASLHPLQTIMDISNAKAGIKDCFFTLEGAMNAVESAKQIVSSFGSSTLSIKKEDKILYHTSAVIASNYLVTLFSQAEQVIEAIGMRAEHLMPLVRTTVSNIEAYGRGALTGPVQRGDWATVKAHIDAIGIQFPDILSLYIELGRQTARLAGRKWPQEMFKVDKVVDLKKLEKISHAHKSRGMRVVFTNGCFDIIHKGHVSYLEHAASLGDTLVIGLNSDESVKRLKGQERPVNDQESRAAVLASLEYVDYVVVFEDDTPYSLIERLRPDVLVKGGDWAIEDIVGGDIVRSCGGEVVTIDFEQGYSTSSIIGKIKSE